VENDPQKDLLGAQINLERNPSSFLHKAQYFIMAAWLSQSQNVASSRSESSGVDSRPKRGVGGGVGSVHFDDALISDRVSCARDTGVLTMTIAEWVFLNERPEEKLSRDDLASPNLVDFEEGWRSEPDSGRRSGDMIASENWFDER
jgi:hypothetical protein